MNIYYKNHIGQTVNLTIWPYMMSESDLFDYEWKYENRNSINPRITRFYKEMTEKNLKISVSARTEEDYNQALMNLFEVTERDVLAKTQGRLYVGEEYLPCYIYKSQKTDFHPGVVFLVNNFSLVSETGNWIRESYFSYSSRSQNTVESQDAYMDYPYDHSYDYASAILAYTAENEGFTEADFKMVVIGPCSNPEVIIAGHSYKVNTELSASETLVIDSVNRKVYKVMVNGEQVNQFHLRDRENSVFRKIPEGNNNVTWDGSFSFELILYEGRSEPRWT